MASNTYGDKVFGLRDIKITNIGGTTQEDLGAAMTAEFVPEYATGNLDGDDRRVAVVTRILGGKLTFSAGTISEAALEIITGVAGVVSGTTPNEIWTQTVSAAAQFPYFKVYAQAYDEGTGDVHVQIHKCKLTSGGSISLQQGQFHTSSFEAEAVDDLTNGVYKLIQHETATAVPAS